MSEQNKLSETEFGRLKLVQKDTIEIITSLGELEYQKILLQKQIDDLKKTAIEIKNREQELLKELSDKYGTISLNLETGEFS